MIKKKLVVLLVEDNKAIIHFVPLCLQANGYLALPYDSGREVIEDIDRLNYDIAIVDRALESMSDTSGDDVAKKLKEKYPEKPIVIMSCYRAINFDCADYYLRKPFKFDDLLDVLKQARVRFFGHTLEDMGDK